MILGFLMIFFIFILPIGLVIFLIIYCFAGKSDEPRYSGRRYDYYDDDPEDDYYYNNGYERGYEDGLRSASGYNSSSSNETKKKGSDEAWKPLPDYVDDYGYYCPDCDADLFDDHCEHEDDWI